MLLAHRDRALWVQRLGSRLVTSIIPFDATFWYDEVVPKVLDTICEMSQLAMASDRGAQARLILQHEHNQHAKRPWCESSIDQPHMSKHDGLGACV